MENRDLLHSKKMKVTESYQERYLILTIFLTHWTLTSFAQEDIWKTPVECKKTTKGAEYRGALSHTEQNHPCQRWDRNQPQPHNYVDDILFPDKNVSLAANFCRNPAGVKERPWCFTATPGVRWQYCSVPDCGCRKSKAGWNYSGKISLTSSGRRCQAWSSQVPHVQSYTESPNFPDLSVREAGNYCRNPDRWETKGPWCYTEDKNVRWEYCNVPYCECKVSLGGHQYGGRISRTRSGRTCQRWDTQTPHAHKYAEKTCGFPEETVSEASNFCRNPEPNELEGPWCFTTDPSVRWEYCEIRICSVDERVVKLSGRTNVSKVIGEAERKDMKEGLTRVELIFLGLFATSLLLTIITILVAIVVVHMYRKRKALHRECKKCTAESHVEENERNTQALKRQTDIDGEYESGAFGDTVYIQPTRSVDPANYGMLASYDSHHLAPGMMTHTYDSIGTNIMDENTHQTTKKISSSKLDFKLAPYDNYQDHPGIMYENIDSPSFHVVISPKTGKKVMKYERRNSVT